MPAVRSSIVGVAAPRPCGGAAETAALCPCARVPGLSAANTPVKATMRTLTADRGDVMAQLRAGSYRRSGAARRRLPAFATQLEEQAARRREIVVEDPAGDVEQVADQRIAQRVVRGGAVPAHGDDAGAAEHGELLRDDRLAEVQQLLQLLDGAALAAEDLEQPDSDGVGERAKEAGLEELELARRRGPRRPRAPRRDH